MSNTPHDVYEDFPGQAEKIHTLKASDTHFAHVLDEYHEVNRAVHRAETRVDAIGEEAETALRQRRMQLKDQIARALAA